MKMTYKNDPRSIFSERPQKKLLRRVNTLGSKLKTCRENCNKKQHLLIFDSFFPNLRVRSGLFCGFWKNRRKQTNSQNLFFYQVEKWIRVFHLTVWHFSRRKVSITNNIHKPIIYTPLTDFEGCIVFFIFLKNRLHTINDTKIICAKLGISDCPKFPHNWSLLAVITRKKLFSQQKFLKKKGFF